jgi:alanine transaminase
MEWPALAEVAPDAFPKDVIARAKALHEEIGSIGAYSHSQGIPLIRQNVAKFIEGRLLQHSCSANLTKYPCRT